jgi:hypothetical protein
MSSTFPSSLIVGDREPLNIKIIKSVKTEEVYESGQENDINLFN